MNLYEMRLQPAPYAAIESGKKTVELRLYDEKRQKITAGDLIRFTNTQTQETFLTKVLAVTRFADFESLYAAFEKTCLGYAPNELANPKDMLAYYSAEDIAKYGVAAIEIKKADVFDNLQYLEEQYQRDKQRRLNNTARILEEVAQTCMDGEEKESFLKNLK